MLNRPFEQQIGALDLLDEIVFLRHCHVNILQWRSGSVGAGENFKTRIDVLELEETLAVVRVLEEGWGGKIDFTDVLLLLKIDGEWKCVAKAYNQNSNTIEK